MPSIERILTQKKAKLYHATPFLELKLFCKSGGVLSRSDVISSGEEYTKFYSDDSDEEKGLIDRTFGNLSDFGAIFANAERGTPNAYGPITIEFDSEVWNNLEDVVVTSENAASTDYSMMNHSLLPEQLERAYEFKFGKWQLSSEMTYYEVSSETNPISFEYATQVIVEPIGDLFDVVRSELRKNGIMTNVVRREMKDKKKEILDQLITYLEVGRPVPQIDVLENDDVLALWIFSLTPKQKNALVQWMKYMKDGTIPCISIDYF